MEIVRYLRELVNTYPEAILELVNQDNYLSFIK